MKTAYTLRPRYHPGPETTTTGPTIAIRTENQQTTGRTHSWLFKLYYSATRLLAGRPARLGCIISRDDYSITAYLLILSNNLCVLAADSNVAYFPVSPSANASYRDATLEAMCATFSEAGTL